MGHHLPFGAGVMYHYVIIFLIFFISAHLDIIHQGRTALIYTADVKPRPQPAPNIPLSLSRGTMLPTMQTRSAGRTATAISRELEEIRLLNKKHHQQERQRLEAEEKRQKDEESAAKDSEETSKTDEDAPAALSEGTTHSEGLDFTADVHNIMNGLDDLAAGNQEDGDEDERSPMKKRPGSSKVPSRRNKPAARQVSPPDPTIPTLKTALRLTPSTEPVDHEYKRTIFELAILLTSEKKFEEFTQALMAFLANAQIVDKQFVINPLNPKSTAKDITMKGDISPNMTKLGEHIKISGNGPTVFSKRKKWDKEEDGRTSRKTTKKEEFQDPTVYFSMFVSSMVPPKDIIDRTTHEWARMNGVRLQIKELQFVDSETVVSLYKVSKLTPKDVILEELKRILLMAQEIARQDALDSELYNFTMDLDVEDTSSLPAMTLKIQAAKLRGEEVSTFHKLNNRAQYARKTWHLEVPSKYAAKMKSLVEIAKTYKCVEMFWGVHAHLSEVTDTKSTASEAKKQVEIAQKHTNYEVSMTAEDLVGVIDLDYSATVYHPVTRKAVGSYSLRYALMNFVKMSDGRPAIAEAHQSSISKPTHLVVPNTPEAERMIGMMNKNLPAYLYHTLIDYDLPADFVEDLLKNSCEATMLAERHRCKWDPTTKTLTTAEDSIQAERAKDFEGAAWFRDEFGLLGKNSARNQTRFAAPEALFDLDDVGSRKTIHDRHKKVQIAEGADTVMGTPPRKNNARSMVDMTGDDEDSASSTSSGSEGTTGSGDNRSRSQATSSEDGSIMSVTGGG